MTEFIIEVHLRKKNQRGDGKYDFFFKTGIRTSDTQVFQFKVGGFNDYWDPFEKFLNKEDVDKVLRNDVVIYERN